MTRKWIVFPGIGLILSLLFYVFAQTLFQFRADHNAVFLFSSRFAQSILSQPGGFAVYLGSFIDQFQVIPLLASVSTAVLICLILFLLSELAGHGFKHILLPLAALMFFMVLKHSLSSAHCIALILALLAAKFTFLFKKRCHQEVFSFIIAALLIWLSGGWAFAYPLILFIVRLQKDKKISFLSPALLVFILLMMMGFSNLIWILPLPLYMGAAMPAFNAATLCLFILLILNLLDIKPSPVLNWASLAVAVIFLVWGIIMYQNSDFHRIERYRQDLKTQQYDKLIKRLEQKDHLTPLECTYANYALAKENKLLSRMFSLPQEYGMNGLISQPIQGTERSLEDFWFLATLYYDLSYLDFAYRLACDYMVLEGTTPAFTMIMIDCLLAEGHIKTADKYIRILGQSLFYRKEAKEYDRLLANRSLYLAHYRSKIQQNPVKDQIIESDPEEHLYTILEKNASNRMAMDYLCAAQLLKKNFSFFNTNIPYLETLYHGELPKHVQEALMFYQLANPDKKIDTGALKINQKEAMNFIEFAKTMSQDPQPVYKRYAAKYADSYMLYCYFMQAKGGVK